MKKNIFIIPEEEINKIGMENQIYGYIKKSGLKNICKEINYLIKYNKIKYIYGIDLGCGDGDAINYFNSNITNSEWIGIELSAYRISLSVNPDIIIEGDLLDLSYKMYNFIYVNNLVFDDVLSNKLETKIINEFNGIIIVTKYFENKNLTKYKINRTIKADTNWQKDYILYIYIIN
jgi:hypothetical protein